jgi:two-component system, OmpR family, alkaline phosphatase synthesis response regulator PhoP
MAKTHILIVEDDADIQQLVSYNLLKSGFHVSCADSGEEGVEILKKEKLDCLLLDLMLPGISGSELCRLLKKGEIPLNAEIPVIMLTAKGEEEDVIAGFDHGADDYITKPFSPKVLISRIKAVLRRSLEAGEERSNLPKTVIAVAGLEIDKGRHEVRINGRELYLTMTEFGILSLLAEKQGWVFTRQQIIDAVRGYDFLVTPRAIDVQIFGLRKKLGDAGNMIETVRGLGYRFTISVNSGETVGE